MKLQQHAASTSANAPAKMTEWEELKNFLKLIAAFLGVLDIGILADDVS